MNASILSPPLECDLVMKGGIASGVVYPLAILELAENYRFRSIGGTSAGAIAAVMTAAAEYGRESGGMARFAKLSDQLTEEDFIKDLLQPSQETSPLMATLFELAGALTGEQRWRYLRLGLTLTRSAVMHMPAAFALGAALGASLSAGYTLLTNGSLSGAGLLTPLLFGYIGGMGGSAYAFSRVLLSHIPKQNFYGMCNGHGNGSPDGPQLLTDWLHTSIQHLAGLDADAAPLTFRQLAEKPFPDQQAQGKTPASEQNPNIELRMVTSNLSQSQPYVLPFGSHSFLFRVCDLEALFPQTVVAYLQQNAYEQPDVQLPEGYCWLPLGNALPVVVAARMSLSFPLLISAVPLYTIKGSAFDRRVSGQPLQLGADDLQQNWFSDGGICSNFPIHFFDAWLPTRPTFGIDLVRQPQEELVRSDSDTVSMESRSVSDVDDALQKADKLGRIDRTSNNLNPDVLSNYFQIPKGQAEEHVKGAAAPPASDCTLEGVTPQADDSSAVVVYLPRADAPRAPEWRKLNGLSDFGMAIFNISQNYRDTMQSLLPSYHERIVRIGLAPHEGGMNLSMTPEIIKEIQCKGRKAGRMIRQRFNMEHHQWMRLLLLMSLMEEQLNTMEAALASGKFNYKALIERQLKSQAESQLHEQFPYPATKEWCAEAQHRIEELHKLIVAIKERQHARETPVAVPHPLNGGQCEQQDSHDQERCEPLPEHFAAILRVTPEL